MFNIKFDWKTIGLIILVVFSLFCGWKIYHNFKIVNSQKDQIIQLEKVVKSQNDAMEKQKALMKIQTDSLNRTVEIERNYNEKIKNLQNDVIANNNLSNSVYKQIDDLRHKNNSFAATNETYIRQIDTLGRLLQDVSRGYEKSTENNSRIKLEFEKCSAFIDEIYLTHDELIKENDIN